VGHAERLGLSQLHQLGGRVGRGAAKSHCLLLTGTSGAEWGPAARERLKVMEETTDGFRIAEADLELRGPGEFLGTRQSGMPDFAVAELTRDQAILQEAREEAFARPARPGRLVRGVPQQLPVQVVGLVARESPVVFVDHRSPLHQGTGMPAPAGSSRSFSQAATLLGSPSPFAAASESPERRLR